VTSDTEPDSKPAGPTREQMLATIEQQGNLLAGVRTISIAFAPLPNGSGLVLHAGLAFDATIPNLKAALAALDDVSRRTRELLFRAYEQPCEPAAASAEAKG